MIYSCKTTLVSNLPGAYIKLSSLLQVQRGAQLVDQSFSFSWSLNCKQVGFVAISWVHLYNPSGVQSPKFKTEYHNETQYRKPGITNRDQKFWRYQYSMWFHYILFFFVSWFFKLKVSFHETLYNFRFWSTVVQFNEQPE